jgi:predicted DNA-binding protein
MGKPSKKIITTVYLTPDQKERLDQLSARTRVPASEFIREGVEEILRRYSTFITSTETKGMIAFPEAGLQESR